MILAALIFFALGVSGAFRNGPLLMGAGAAMVVVMWVVLPDPRARFAMRIGFALLFTGLIVTLFK